MLKVCVDLGGTISGEHGIGSDKREAMRWLFTRETLALFRRLKNAFDPDNLCNPDKLIPLVSNTKTVSPHAMPPVPEKKEPPKVSADGCITPTSEEEIVGYVKEFAKQKTHFGIQGLATKYRVRDSMILQPIKLNQIIDFDKGNLTLTVQAGATIDQINEVIVKEKQHLWIQSPGTIGGIIATRSSVVPPLRDLILGMRLLLPTGEVVKLGAKTMKNVAGYDVPKLLLGSWGTLAMILDVTFRLYPYPAAQLKSVEPRPFSFKDIHRKIKKAFDPDGILSQRMTVLTPEEAAAPPDKTSGPVKGRDNLQNLADKFWL
jgi:FAD/FMN-containing dehydrogenase